MSYKNFNDPLGLFFRMLYSRNRTAYFVLFREVFTVFMKPLDWLLHFKENKILEEASPAKEPLILILGGSRTGTTLLYQTLVNTLQVSYLNNFDTAFPHSLLTARTLFGRFIGKSRKTSKSYYGSIAGFGSPSDAFPIWNKWFGEDRNHINVEIGETEKQDMQRFVNAWHGFTGKPLLNKNNRNSLCAPLLNSIFENVFFIEIYRDPVYTAQSLVYARKMVQGDVRKGWGLLGQDFTDDAPTLAHIDEICAQVHAVDKILAIGRNQIDGNKYYRISYERFCEDPASVVGDIAKKALGIDLKQGDLQEVGEFKSTNKQRLGDVEFTRINKCIADLYGKDSVTDYATGNIVNTPEDYVKRS